MRIAELSERTGVAVPSIKYYVRERLLPPGDRSGHNQVAYDDTHVRRLRLIRALREIGELRVDVIRSVLDAVDNPDNTLHNVLGTIQRSLATASVPDVLRAAERIGHPDVTDLLEPYRAAAADLAGREVAWLTRASHHPLAVAERSVVGTVLGDALLTAVRRDEQRQASAATFNR